MASATLAAFAVVGTGAVSSSAHAEPQLINGAGATFPVSDLHKWFSEFQKKQSAYAINYQSSGAVAEFANYWMEQSILARATSPMTMICSSHRKKVPILHIPTVMGAVVITYNLPALKESLHLSADVIAAIYMGKIQKWNDPQIAQLNPGVELPDLAILPVYRSDGSGTTAVFTDYLSKTSADWKAKVGQGNAVKFPEGVGGKGNEGVTGVVKQTKGAIGYVELIYAKSNSLSYAKIKNSAGQFVEPSVDSVTAAADASAKTIPADLRVSITNASGKNSYPISAFTYLLVYKDMPKQTGEGITQFITWALGADGQAMGQATFLCSTSGKRCEKSGGDFLKRLS